MKPTITAHTWQHIGILGMHEISEISTVVEDHVEGLPVRPHDGLVNAPHVFLICLSFPRIHCHTRLGDCCSCVVLGGKDVTGAPLDLR